VIGEKWAVFEGSHTTPACETGHFVVNIERAEILRGGITSAFRNSPQPKTADLFVNLDDPECVQMLGAFDGRTWQELTEGTLTTHYSALTFFSTKAFVFYLPAFMVLGLHSGEDSACLREILISDMLGFVYASPGGRTWNRYAALSKQQCEVVQETLTFWRESCPPDGTEESIDLILEAFCRRNSAE